MTDGYKLIVGIDWASENHQVCVIDANGSIIDERRVEHSVAGLDGLVARLLELANGRLEDIAVGIEVPRGPVVELLVERGFHVYSINPKQLDRFRDRHTVAGAKDDRRDAFVIADSLRTDRRLFRRLTVDDPIVIQIREFVRAEANFIEQENAVASRIREQLNRFVPQILALCPAVDEVWFWRLIELFIERKGRITRANVGDLLRSHRIRRVTADEVFDAIKHPTLSVAPGTVEAVAAHISLLLPSLFLARSQRSTCEKKIEELLDALPEPEEQEREHRDVDILRSLPGVGRVVAATMLAEASSALRERDYHVIRAHTGVAPVTRQTGKKTTVAMRYACSDLLRDALFYWAHSASQHDPAARAQYRELREKGNSHGRACRGVGDRLLRILIGMLKEGSLYDPARSTRRAERLAGSESCTANARSTRAKKTPLVPERVLAAECAG
jgi:transposase